MPQGRTDLLFKGGTNMSYTFSRRNFMKYTALTAVAIAGSGMLTGCSNPNRPSGTVGSKLSPGDRICDATLKSATYTGNTLTCNFDIYTKVSLQINKTISRSTSLRMIRPRSITTAILTLSWIPTLLMIMKPKLL